MFVIQSMIKQLLEKEKNSDNEIDKALAFTLAVGLADIGGSVCFGRPRRDLSKLNEVFCRFYAVGVNHPEQIALAKFRAANFWEGERSALFAKIEAFDQFKEEVVEDSKPNRVRYVGTIASEVLI